MANKYFGYKGIELWDDKAWEGRISRIDGYVQYIGEHSMDIPKRFESPKLSETELRKTYSGKVGAYLLPGFFEKWEQQGLILKPLDMTEHWLCAVPSKALPKGDISLPVLTIFLRGDYGDRYWPMNIASAYEDYLEAAIRDNWIMLFILSNKGPDRDRTYVNIIQEAGALFPCDMNRLYMEISSIREGLKDIKSEVDDPEKLVEAVTSLKIPALYMKGSWEYRGSLTRDLVMADKYSIRSFDRDAFIRSETGRKLCEAMELEHRFDTVEDEGLIRHFDEMGLKLEMHKMRLERWITLTPKCVFDRSETGIYEHKKDQADGAINGERFYDPATPEKSRPGYDEKLPLFCVMQEVYEGNEHLSVTALSYFYELCRIAAQGSFILLFFVLEDADSNDLLSELIDEASELYPVDRSRVYVTGHSHDGRFTLEFAERNYKKIAAAATLGNFCGLEDAGRLGSAGVTDDRMEQLRSIELPLANFCGCCEHGGKLPLNVDARELPLRPGQEFGRTLELSDRLKSWHRRLYAWNCNDRTDEEILAAKKSRDIVERELGFPVDLSSVRVMDGFRCFIGDLKDRHGRYLLRMVGLENMPHLPTPAMLALCWEFVSRFARDQETGEIIELW